MNALRVRPRAWLAAALLMTVAVALASRRWPLPGVLAEYPGDALYTVAAFWTLLLLQPRAGGGAAALLALALSVAVELSQLCDVAWLADLRSTTLGALLLGQGFQAADLAAYAVGAALAWALDRRLARRGVGPSPPGR